MNFNLYVFGHNKSYSQYPIDSSTDQLKSICINQNDGIQFTAFRKEKLMFYSYSRNVQTNNGFESFGVAVAFNGVYCKDIKALIEIFESLFSEIFLRGVFISVTLDGSVSLLNSSFASNIEEIQNIDNFLKKHFDSILKNDFANLNAAFKPNTGYLNLSSNNTNEDMLNSFKEYEGFTISDFDQTDSEITRVHQELRNLFEEKQKITLQYKKLLGQKKQYKLVGLLATGVFIAVVAILVFKSDIQKANNKISNLESTLNNKELTISEQKEKISEQLSRINNYTSNIRELQNEKTTLQAKMSIKSDSLIILKNKYNQLASDYSNLEYNADYYKRQYNSQASIISELRQYKPVQYRTRYSNTYFYTSCGGKYEKTSCYYPSQGTRVSVYLTKDGYALTSLGFLRLSELVRD